VIRVIYEHHEDIGLEMKENSAKLFFTEICMPFYLFFVLLEKLQDLLMFITSLFQTNFPGSK